MLLKPKLTSKTLSIKWKIKLELTKQVSNLQKDKNKTSMKPPNNSPMETNKPLLTLLEKYKRTPKISNPSSNTVKKSTNQEKQPLIRPPNNKPKTLSPQSALLLDQISLPPKSIIWPKQLNLRKKLTIIIGKLPEKVWFNYQTTLEPKFKNGPLC